MPSPFPPGLPVLQWGQSIPCGAEPSADCWQERWLLSPHSVSNRQSPGRGFRRHRSTTLLPLGSQSGIRDRQAGKEIGCQKMHPRQCPTHFPGGEAKIPGESCLLGLEKKEGQKALEIPQRPTELYGLPSELSPPVFLPNNPVRQAGRLSGGLGLS